MSTLGPGQSTELLIDVVAVLNAAHIDYAVIGALAVSVHGVVRASQDADAIIHASISKLSELDLKLKSQGLRTELRKGDMDDPIPALLLVSDEYGNRVDLLAGLRGMDPAVYKRTIDVQIPGLVAALRIVGREDLVAMKAFAGGPQDLIDAKRCIAVADTELDLNLLRKITAGYGREAIANCEKLIADSEKKIAR
jgi:hypothetical protein